MTILFLTLNYYILLKHIEQPHYRYESKPKVEAEISECETLDEGEKVGDISAHIGQKKIKLTL